MPKHKTALVLEEVDNPSLAVRVDSNGAPLGKLSVTKSGIQWKAGNRKTKALTWEALHTYMYGEGTRTPGTRNRTPRTTKKFTRRPSGRVAARAPRR